MKDQKINTDKRKIDSILTRGVSNIYKYEELKEKLLSGKQLHIKFGTDVTGPDLTLGHTVIHRKIRDLQELGHKVTMIIGDYTTLIGDHSDKLEMRKETSLEEIEALSKTYQSQFFKTLRKENVEIRYNSEWLSKLSFKDILELSKNFTISQMMDRETNKIRFEQNSPIGLDEFLYPIMQGYDSVALNCDIELGATEQLFNLMSGRKLMEFYGQKPQSCITMKLLKGNDGRKMGKSLGNYISVNAEPNDMYGKLMSIVDDVIIEFFELITRVPMEEVKEMENAILAGENPMKYKKQLAFEVTSFYYGVDIANEAAEYFEKTVQKKEIADDIKVIVFESEMTALELAKKANPSLSNTQVKRLIEQGGIKYNNSLIDNANLKINQPGVLKIGKRLTVKIEFK